MNTTVNVETIENNILIVGELDVFSLLKKQLHVVKGVVGSAK